MKKNKQSRHAPETHPSENVESILRTIWARLFVAMSHVVVMVVFVGIQAGLSWLGKEVVPESWRTMGQFFDATLFVAFAVVYLSILWEIVAVFLPGLRGRQPSGEASSSAKSSAET